MPDPKVFQPNAAHLQARWSIQSESFGQLVHAVNTEGELHHLGDELAAQGGVQMRKRLPSARNLPDEGAFRQALLGDRQEDEAGLPREVFEQAAADLVCSRKVHVTISLVIL